LKSKSKSRSKNYLDESETSVDQLSRYRGMPVQKPSKSPFSRSNIFRRSEDFLMQKRERTLEKRRLAIQEKEKKEMENCSFNPKIHSNAYLRNKKIHLNSRVNSKCFDTAQTNPTTPQRESHFEKSRTNDNDQGEYMELEFYEEQGNLNVLDTFFGPSKSELEMTKNSKIELSQERRSATPQRKKTDSKLSNLREFRTPNNKNSKSNTLWKPIRFEDSKKKHVSPVRPNRISKEAFFKRSIVVLNENDEFEDLDVYLAKLKASEMVVKKTKENLKKKAAEIRESKAESGECEF
jgi:hypothetical protein